MATIATLSHPITETAMDAMSDAEYDALERECLNGLHPQGACPLCVEDDLDELDLADTFGSAAADQDRWSYLDKSWRSRGFDWARKAPIPERTKAMIIAHRMVQSFVETFADADGKPFAVSFSAGVKTAGTDFDARQIVVSPAPVFDPSIDSAKAAQILTAMACHEASHVKYGTRIERPLKAAFGAHDRVPYRLSNILEDVRIERRFGSDYPGYSQIFKPALRYVAETELKAAGVKLHRPSVVKPVDIAGAAIRYPEFCDWSDPIVARERDWWQAWAARWGAAGISTKDHIAAVREGMIHARQVQNELDDKGVEETRKEAAESQSDKTDQGSPADADPMDGEPDGDPDGESTEDDAEGESEETSTDGDSGSQNASTEASESEDESDQVDGPTYDADGRLERDYADPRTSNEAISESRMGQDMGESVPGAAINSAGVAPTQAATTNQDHQAVVNDAKDKTIVEVDGDEYYVEGIKIRQITNPAKGSRSVPMSQAASAIIRATLMRSRSGHRAINRGTKRGRCDNRSLPKIAMQDYRLFHRRENPSPGRYNVMMMIDWSSSMSGLPSEQTVATVKAIAEAAKYVDSIRMSIHAWTNSVAISGAHRASTVAAAGGVYEAWRSGQSLDDIDLVWRVMQSGTPDAYCLAYAVTKILQETDRNEQPIIMMLTDGFGTGESEVRTIVEDANKKGIRVISVAIGAIDKAAQERMYGEGNVIPWQGDIVATARPIAALLGKLVAS